MNKTKIDWADMTWNPVTGCLYNCPYCYARKIALRFSSNKNSTGKTHVCCGDPGIKEIYPFGFDPCIYEWKMREPEKIKKPQNVFVCSMADLFGDWIPDEWIQEVFKACKAAPQHRYLFLTKNPKRYKKLSMPDNITNFWFGTSISIDVQQFFFDSNTKNTFLSIEPIQCEFKYFNPCFLKWVIVGAETGNRKDRTIPKREWIKTVLSKCRDSGVPVFMKNSLAEIWGEPLIQEYPWKMAKKAGITA